MCRNFVISLLSCLSLAACNRSAQPVVVEMGFDTKLYWNFENDSKAAGDGSDVNVCVMEVFYAGSSCQREVSAVTAGSASFNVSLVAGRTYDIAFWACEDGKYSTESLKNVSCTSGNTPQDAFCAVLKNVTIDQNPGETQVSLKRPLAMLNVSPAPSSVTFLTPLSYNVLSDTMGEVQECSCSLSSFFLFTGSECSYTSLTVDSKSLTQVPVQRNYKTNITIN